MSSLKVEPEQVLDLLDEKYERQRRAHLVVTWIYRAMNLFGVILIYYQWIPKESFEPQPYGYIPVVLAVCLFVGARAIETKAKLIDPGPKRRCHKCGHYTPSPILFVERDGSLMNHPSPSECKVCSQ